MTQAAGSDDVFEVQPLEPAVEEAPAPRRSRREQLRPRGAAYRWRLFTGLLGASAVLGAQMLLYSREMRGLWQGITAGLEHTWFQYSAMGLALFLAALVAGMVSAFMDTSAARSFFRGAGWCALLVLGMLAYRVKQPAGPAGWPLSVRLAEAALNPSFIDRAGRLDKERALAAGTKKDLRDKLEAQEKATQDATAQGAKLKQRLDDLTNSLPDKLKKAEQRGAAAKAAELEPMMQQKDGEIAAANQQLQDAKKRADELELLNKELETARDARIKELVELKANADNLQAQLEAANKRIAELEAAASKQPAKPKEEPPPQEAPPTRRRR